MKKMRRQFLLWFSLMILFAVGLVGCGKNENSDENKVSVYYISNSETKVENHEYVLKGGTAEEQLQELMDCLSTLPEKPEYKVPLGMGFKVLKVDAQDGRVTLDMDKAYRELPATTEVLVRAAIVRTLTQIEEISYVGITVEGQQLYDNAGEQVGWMSAKQFIDNDGNEINTYEQVRLKLYFASEGGDQLIASYREKYYSTNTPLERFVVEELIAGPSSQSSGLYPAINPETKLINIMTKDGICYVNLDSGFLSVADNVSVEVAVYAIVDSLTELSNVNKVQILVNGEAPVDFFSTNTFERNLDYVTKLEP
ncbi:MAG: GerMN domain-containing protein [Bacteroidales bacterium]|nr:GerMN domain-containing protein [Lachnoclostridium sp.]MCM1384776.1 GerMN domain-containing protein [Lachnoclostridium sp.]MCM1465080.1 GerMN domain-containing protein [Bacteroidales bacterium]